MGVNRNSTLQTEGSVAVISSVIDDVYSLNVLTKINWTNASPYHSMIVWEWSSNVLWDTALDLSNIEWKLIWSIVMHCCEFSDNYWPAWRKQSIIFLCYTLLDKHIRFCHLITPNDRVAQIWFMAVNCFFLCFSYLVDICRKTTKTHETEGIYIYKMPENQLLLSIKLYLRNIFTSVISVPGSFRYITCKWRVPKNHIVIAWKQFILVSSKLVLTLYFNLYYDDNLLL